MEENVLREYIRREIKRNILTEDLFDFFRGILNSVEAVIDQNLDQRKWDAFYKDVKDKPSVAALRKRLNNDEKKVKEALMKLYKDLK